MRPDSMHSRLSRRDFLARVGAAGGAAALYETMVAMGMAGTRTAWAGPPELEAGQGDGQSVLILGAGVAGLTTAYILNQYGYRCRILEATHRAGGRNHTARRGEHIIEQSPEHGRTVQRCDFDEGLYVNLGPGRLPYHHRRVLGYCRELGVALEPYVMNTTGNLFQSVNGFGGTAVPYREVKTDARGYISEMLARVIAGGNLDDELNPVERERLLELLRQFGDLGAVDSSDRYSYQGSDRMGCDHDHSGDPTPNVLFNCKTPRRGDFSELLASEFWDHDFYDPLEYRWQPTLFQPVGGMDMIVQGFLRQVGHLIEYEAPVIGIENGDDEVAVTYVKGDKEVTETADHCISNIPTSVLAPIIEDESTFDVDFRQAARETRWSASVKVGWQTNTRFWEGPPTDIYGGISWTDDIIEQIWYPSNDYFARKGALTGAYIHDNSDRPNARLFGALGLGERLEAAREGGARMHEEFEDDAVVPTSKGVSVAWQNVPHQGGAWPSWGSNQNDDARYRRLLLGDGRFHITGDQTSTLPGWQEGAMMSAEYVVGLISGQQRRDDLPTAVKAPDTRSVLARFG